MNERELLISTLKGSSPEKMAWFADLSYWYNGNQNSGKLPSKYKGEDGYLKLHQDMGVGIYLYAPFPVEESYGETVKYQEKWNGDTLTASFSTPLGNLISTQKYSNITFSMSYVEHFIKEPKDLVIMRFIFENLIFKKNYSEFTRIDKLWGDYGLPAILPPRCTSPLQLLISRWAGIQTTISLYMDAPNEFEKTIKHLEICDDNLYDMLADAPGVFVIFTENLHASVTGRNFIETYEIPYWQKRIKQLHNKGKFVGVHNDGGVRGSLDLLSQTGFDFVEAVTPTPVGDMKIEEIKQVAKDKIVIWGGIPGALFSPMYSEEYFEEYVRNVLITFPIGSNFVLGVADQVPPDASLTRVCKVCDIINNMTK